jgi:hypothetical protein
MRGNENDQEKSDFIAKRRGLEHTLLGTQDVRRLKNSQFPNRILTMIPPKGHGIAVRMPKRGYEVSHVPRGVLSDRMPHIQGISES